MNMKEYLEMVYDANDKIRKALASLEPVETFSVIATAIDEYAVLHELDTMETWEALHTVAKEVNKEKGDADYVKEWKNDGV